MSRRVLFGVGWVGTTVLGALIHLTGIIRRALRYEHRSAFGGGGIATSAGRSNARGELGDRT